MILLNVLADRPPYRESPATVRQATPSRQSRIKKNSKLKNRLIKWMLQFLASIQVSEES
jgi:hypothetical protein